MLTTLGLGLGIGGLGAGFSNARVFNVTIFYGGGDAKG